MNTTTPDERSEKDGLAREPRELSSEELESIIGGVGIGISNAVPKVGIDGIRLGISEEVAVPKVGIDGIRLEISEDEKRLRIENEIRGGDGIIWYR